MKVDNKDDLVVDFIFCLAVDILTNFSKSAILKEPNQSNIVTYRTPPRFSRGVLYSFLRSRRNEFDKNASSILRAQARSVRYFTLHRDWFGDYRSLRFLGVNFG